jgi:transketolase
MHENVTTVSDRTMANAIRALAMDAVQNANSGHPGMPMGMADAATVLFSKFLKFDPRRPDWPDRDRFVLSAGHGSMLLYSLLHLTGYARPTMDDIRNFRQLGHPCAGHPEFGMLPGVECTTGPLGQGLAMAVGMAMAERLQEARYGKDIVDHHTYVIAGDGCLMEGISHEAISLAGHLKLSKLILLWDDNDISIDGPLSLSCSDNQAMRFEAAGWHVQSVDGHDAGAVEAALSAAKKDTRPSMIACKTTIGFGAPNKQGTASTHGAPLGDEEIAGTRKALDWPHAPFEVPDEILSAWRAIGARGAGEADKWQVRFDGMDENLRAQFESSIAGEIPQKLDDGLAQFIKAAIADPKKMATRKASQLVLEVVNAACAETIGGSADLTGSNNTKTGETATITADDFGGRYIYYGIREFAMGAVMNGMALHRGFIPYGGTFLVFTDYARPAIRLSALMGQRVIYVMTHDSIGLGEDGPTHQPVEHIPSLRAMPNLIVYRPCDVVETAECWQLALHDQKRPSVIALSRQGLEQVRLSAPQENLCGRGGYVIREADGDAKVTIIASGSEVETAIAAKAMLDNQGIPTRVVSMPSTELFDAQDKEYRARVLGKGALRVSLEAAATMGWEKYTGLAGLMIGIEGFGQSAPAGDLFDHFGLTAEKVSARILQQLENK